MKYLKENFSVLFSPKFWGVLAFAVINYLQAKGWIAGEEIQLLEAIVGLTTGIGVVDSVARKIGGKK